MIDAVNVVDIIVYQRYWDNKISVSFGHYQKRVGTWLRNLKKKEKGVGEKCRITDITID